LTFGVPCFGTAEATMKLILSGMVLDQFFNTRYLIALKIQLNQFFVGIGIVLQSQSNTQRLWAMYLLGIGLKQLINWDQIRD
jgi:hypothetical protein